MPRAITGNLYTLPDKLVEEAGDRRAAAQLWAAQVWQLMDEGKTEDEAKRLVKERYEQPET